MTGRSVRSSRWVRSVVTVALVTVVTSVVGSLPRSVPAGAAGTAALSVAPATGLRQGSTVSVVLTGASPGSVYVVAECDPTAYTLLGEGATPSDACDSRHDSVMGVDAGGGAATTLAVQAVLTTALGAADCRAVQCFLAVESIDSTGGPSLLVQDLTFSAGACPRPTSCTTPADAWDPVLGPGPFPAAAVRAASARSGTRTPTRTGRVPTATPGDPVTEAVVAGTAGDLTTPAAVTGPYGSAFPAPVVPPAPVTGEGLLRLALAAPHTDWGAASPSSTVVDVTLTDTTTGTSAPTQQFVLYEGATTFTYAGFVGPVTTGDAYRVTVAAEPPAAAGGLSWPSGSHTPTATVVDRQLLVVDPTNPSYLAAAYAPVLYGRSTSALHDVPLLVDATVTPLGDGADRLSYTVIWSHEDAGTGFVPFLEWGEWGRMTDIEDAVAFDVAADGTVSDATYLWGGEPATGFPDSQGALQEVDEPFTGTWDGTHPVLRDATGNNDFAESGTTAFRFQLAPVPGPAPGQNREAVMDANPWTYEVSGTEVLRWYGDVSTDPSSPAPGDARQYATVDLDTTGTGVTSVDVALQLSGGTSWYRSDLGTGYPLVGAGHVRTVVKLPVGWQDQQVTGVQVQVSPPAAASSVSVTGLTVLALSAGWSLGAVPTPTPTVVPGGADLPPQLVTTTRSGDGQTVAPGRAFRPLVVGVADALGQPLDGAPVTFTTATPGATFARCGCTSVTVAATHHGTATSGPVRAPGVDGPVVVTATTGDTAASPSVFTLTVAG